MDNPFLGKGLTLAQRLCFFNAMFHFLHGLPRLIFLVAPLPYMFANIYVIYATAAAIFAYVVPHMVHSALTNFILQRGYRYPFMGGVYETVLSWYILLPTTVALFMPHKGKFNVTAKGGTIGEKYLDWSVSKPCLVLMALNLIGLGIGLYKAFFDPNPEYLTLVINMGWILYNLMILGATMAVAVEEVQTHQFPRVQCKIEASVQNQAGKSTNVTLTEYSQDEVRFKCSESALFAKDDALSLVFIYKGQTYTFNTTVKAIEGDFVELSMLFATFDEERHFNRCTFSREGMWASPKEKIDDRMSSGFFKLIEIALYGYRSMIEFLPGRWQYCRRGLLWLRSFMPKIPTTEVLEK